MRILQKVVSKALVKFRKTISGALPHPSDWLIHYNNLGLCNLFSFYGKMLKKKKKKALFKLLIPWMSLLHLNTCEKLSATIWRSARHQEMNRNPISNSVSGRITSITLAAYFRTKLFNLTITCRKLYPVCIWYMYKAFYLLLKMYW